MNLVSFILLGVLLAVSAAFSGSETVLFSLSRHDRLRMKKSKNRLEVLAAQLLDDPRSLITTLMIGNMGCNILIFVLSTLLLGEVERQAGKGVVAALVLLPTLLVTYVSDVFPKVLGSLNNTRIAPFIAIPIATLVRIAWPVSKAIDVAILRPVHRLVSGGRKERPTSQFTVEELNEMLEMSQEQGVIDVSENELLQEVVRIGELRVRDVMTPRVDVVAFHIKDSPDRLLELFRKSHLTKLPVYDGPIDNVIGLIYAKEVFLEADPRKVEVRRMLHPIHFVPEFQTLDRLLGRFRQTRTQLAAVVDEFGGLVGVVSLEDVVEQMVGDIYEPHDAPAQAVERVGPDEYRVAGDLSIVDWEEAFGVTGTMLEGGGGPRMSTVAGLLASLLKRIPKTGDQVRLGRLVMTVESMRGRRVDRVRLKLVGSTPEESLAAAGGAA